MLGLGSKDSGISALDETSTPLEAYRREIQRLTANAVPSEASAKTNRRYLIAGAAAAVVGGITTLHNIVSGNYSSLDVGPGSGMYRGAAILMDLVTISLLGRYALSKIDQKGTLEALQRATPAFEKRLRNEFGGDVRRADPSDIKLLQGAYELLKSAGRQPATA